MNAFPIRKIANNTNTPCSKLITSRYTSFMKPKILNER